jgi:hypothetical protein
MSNPFRYFNSSPEGVGARLQEAAIVLPILADQDRFDRRLHVVVDAARAGALEEGESSVVRVEHHLLGLTRIGANEQNAAVAEANMRTLLSTTISWLQSNW